MVLICRSVLCGRAASACPYVAGVAALYLNGHPSASHDVVKASLMCSATGNVLSNQPPSTANLLLYANVQPCSSAAASSSSSATADFTATQSSSATSTTSPMDELQPPPSLSPLNLPMSPQAEPSRVDTSTSPSFEAADPNPTDEEDSSGVADASDSPGGRNGSGRMHETRSDALLWIVLMFMMSQRQ